MKHVAARKAGGPGGKQTLVLPELFRALSRATSRFTRHSSKTCTRRAASSGRRQELTRSSSEAGTPQLRPRVGSSPRSENTTCANDLRMRKGNMGRLARLLGAASSLVGPGTWSAEANGLSCVRSTPLDQSRSPTRQTPRRRWRQESASGIR